VQPMYLFSFRSLWHFGIMLVVGGNATMEIQTANSKRPGAKKIVIHFDFMPRPYGPIGMVVVALPVIN